jgi:hypothetical protein
MRKLTKVYGWHEELSVVACGIRCEAVDVPAGSYTKAEDGELYFNEEPDELGTEGNWFATFADTKRAALKELRQRADDTKTCLSIIRSTKLVNGEIVNR